MLRRGQIDGWWSGFRDLLRVTADEFDFLSDLLLQVTEGFMLRGSSLKNIDYWMCLKVLAPHQSLADYASSIWTLSQEISPAFKFMSRTVYLGCSDGIWARFLGCELVSFKRRRWTDGCGAAGGDGRCWSRDSLQCSRRSGPWSLSSASRASISAWPSFELCMCVRVYYLPIYLLEIYNCFEEGSLSCV